MVCFDFIDSTELDDNVDEEVEDYEMSEFKSCQQISDELITLSLLPNSRWQNLLNLDIIKVNLYYIYH
jgi:U3 small nucleolar RNA-associated protein 21